MAPAVVERHPMRRAAVQPAGHAVEHVADVAHETLRHRWCFDPAFTRMNLQAAHGVLPRQREQAVVRVLAHAVTHIQTGGHGTAGVVEDAKQHQRIGCVATGEVVLHCLVLDGVYRRGGDGEPVFVEVAAPSDEALQAVVHKIITRTMKLPTRLEVLVDEEGSTYKADDNGDSDEARVLGPLQAAPSKGPERRQPPSIERLFRTGRGNRLRPATPGKFQGCPISSVDP